MVLYMKLILGKSASSDCDFFPLSAFSLMIETGFVEQSRTHWLNLPTTKDTCNEEKSHKRFTLNWLLITFNLTLNFVVFFLNDNLRTKVQPIAIQPVTDPTREREAGSIELGFG